MKEDRAGGRAERHNERRLAQNMGGTEREAGQEDRRVPQMMLTVDNEFHITKIRVK